MISKKSIRYEGTLYSINEKDTTLALQNVRSFGTEGREKNDPTGNTAAVPPQEGVHAYLLFRGCDIADLHVHEEQAAAPQEPEPAPEPPAPEPVPEPPKEAPTEVVKPPKEEIKETREPPKEEIPAPTPTPPTTTTSPIANTTTTTTTTTTNEAKPSEVTRKESTEENKFTTVAPRHNRTKPRPRGHDNKRVPIGTGASLLHRKARGAHQGIAMQTPKDDFDFESSLAQFDKVKISDDPVGQEQEDNDHSEEKKGTFAYSNDDFFDSISCDALDKLNGIDNRLRGAAERSLNMEAFGAFSLQTGHRGRRYNHNRGGGRGRGGRYHRSGRGRGRGRGGRGRGRDMSRGRQQLRPAIRTGMDS